MDSRSNLVPRLCEIVWQAERELNLYDRKVAGTAYWALVRHLVFDRLLLQDAPRQTASPPWSRTVAGRVARHLGSVVTDLGALPWPVPTGIDTIVVPHPRKFVRNGQVGDRFCDCVLSDETFGRVLVLDLAGPPGHFQERSQRLVRHRGVIGALGQIYGRLGYARYIPDLAAEHAELEHYFRHNYARSFPLSPEVMARNISIHEATRTIARTVLRRTGARRMFIVNAYGEKGLVAAAKDVGMQVMELQHGAIAPYHFGYSFPGRPVVHHAPDYLLVFGQYWTENIDLPAGMRTVVIGSRNLASYRQHASARVPRRILIASQGVTGRQLFDAMLVAAPLAPDWEFVFRPHPGERPGLYRRLLRSRPGNPANLTISGHEEDIYRVLTSAEVQIGVYSTTLFEGMALGLRTVVYKLPGMEFMQPVLDSGEAVLAYCPQDIPALLETAPGVHNPERYYAPPVTSVGELLSRVAFEGCATHRNDSI